VSSPRVPDTLFGLPSVDDPASTEVGVILMGLDAERLLAGLGLASLADDPALVTLAVDQARHEALSGLTIGSLAEAGAHRWRSVRDAFAEAVPAGSLSGSLRQEWVQTTKLLTGPAGETGPATLAYFVACWLRRDEVDRRAAR
jgi:hypothetical protein